MLDTTFVVDAERNAAAWGGAIEDDDDAAIAAVTLAELLVGVHLASSRYRERRRAFVDDLVATVPIVSYDARVAAAHASLLAAVRRAGEPRGAHDLMIAATAVASDRLVVTADAAGFADLPGVGVLSHS